MRASPTTQSRHGNPSYFDATNFATESTARPMIALGLIDETCRAPPVSSSARTTSTAPKKCWCGVDSTHRVCPNKAQKQFWERSEPGCAIWPQAEHVTGEKMAHVGILPSPPSYRRLLCIGVMAAWLLALSQSDGAGIC